jgi:hypothetical protein
MPVAIAQAFFKVAPPSTGLDDSKNLAAIVEDQVGQPDSLLSKIFQTFCQ